MKLFLIVSAVLVAQAASARVFDFKEESLSTYLRATGGLSNLKKSAFSESSGTDTLFDDKVEFNFSGEVGVAFSFSALTIRLGVEGLIPQKLNPAEGKDVGGTKLMDLDSSALVFIPRGTVEFVLFRDDASRLIAGVGVGYGTMKVTNKYTLTTDGQVAYPGIDDYSEVIKGTTLGGDVSLGIESLFVDNVTFTAEVGYRFYKFTGLKHEQAATTFAGAVNAGDPALNDDGSERSLDMKGIFAGVGLRFYIDFPY